MTHSFRVTINEKHLARAQRIYVVRRFGWRFVLVFVLAVGLVSHAVFTGATAWWLGAVTAAVLFAILLPPLLWYVLKQRRRQFFRLVQDGRMDYEFSDQSLRVRYSSGASEAAWHTVTDLRKSRDAWVVSLAAGRGFFVLPPEQVPQDALAFLSSAVESHGGSVGGTP